MWVLRNPEDKYFLSEVDEHKKVHTVKEIEAAKTFDSEDQADGYGMAVKHFSGFYFETIDEDNI